MKILNDLLKRIRSQDHQLTDIAVASDALQHTKIVEYCQTKGSPRLVGQGNDIAGQAIAGAWSSGYLECLDDILRFKEKYLLEALPVERPVQDFGGTQAAVEKGYLTKEEADDLN